MPELPDVVVYVEALRDRILGETLRRVRLGNPFLLRSVDPPLNDVAGRKVTSITRLGKRVVIGVESDLHLVIHLMIAGRFRWKEVDAPIPKKIGLAAFDFDAGTLVLTEAGTKRRASLHLVRGHESLATHSRGGAEPLEVTLEQFEEALTRENHTLKRTLTDPRIFSGIGNAYSDEILHRAKLSPLLWTTRLDAAQTRALFEATRAVLEEWVERLRSENAGAFPDKVTAFREEMAVHGRYGKPCPVCGKKVQRIVYAENETNYCAECQTGGRLLADRSLSRLLHGDWPKTLEELESVKDDRRSGR